MDAFGLRLVIHEPGTFPFPEEEGFTLNPRYETTIGMRLVSFDIFFLLFISSLYIFMVSHAKLNLFEVYHLIKIKIPKNVFEYRDFFLTKMIEILLMFQGILSKSLRTSWSVRIWKRLHKNVWDTLHNTGNFLSY